MVTGFNTDVQHGGKVYHVQTEDRGRNNPIIETLIYRGGEILAARRSSYIDLLEQGAEEKLIAEKIEAQHNQMIADIQAGRYEVKQQMPFGAGIISSKSFDEVVLQYLQSLSEMDPIVLALVGTKRLVEGTEARLEVLVSRQTGGQGIAGAQVKAKLLSTTGPVRPLAEGTTNAEGLLSLACPLPVIGKGSSVLVLQATTDDEAAELKRPVEKRARRAAG